MVGKDIKKKTYIIFTELNRRTIMVFRLAIIQSMYVFHRYIFILYCAFRQQSGHHRALKQTDHKT